MITHGNVGGVTNARYSVNTYGDVKMTDLWNKSPISRRLKHVLSPTLTGITASENQQLDNKKRKRNQPTGVKIHTHTMRAISATTKVEVLAPCVLNRSGWVRRLMSQQELLNSYNVDTELEQLLVESNLLNDALEVIVRAAPGKVCTALCNGIKASLTHPVKEDTPTPPKQRNKIDWVVKEELEDNANDDDAKRDDDWDTDVSQ